MEVWNWQIKMRQSVGCGTLGGTLALGLGMCKKKCGPTREPTHLACPGPRAKARFDGVNLVHYSIVVYSLTESNTHSSFSTF